MLQKLLHYLFYNDLCAIILFFITMRSLQLLLHYSLYNYLFVIFYLFVIARVTRDYSDASAYANGLVKTAGFTSALCIATAEGGLRKRHNVSCEESPGRGDCAQVDVCRCINSAGWQKSRDTPASPQISMVTSALPRYGKYVARMLHTYTRGNRNSRRQRNNEATERSEKVSSRRAISCAPRNTIYILCVTLSSYPASRRKALRVCSWSLQSARGQTSPALEVPLWKCHDRLREKKPPGVNREETSDPAAASLVSREINKKTRMVGILRVTRISADVRRARAEYFTSLCCARYGER